MGDMSFLKLLLLLDSTWVLAHPFSRSGSIAHQVHNLIRLALGPAKILTVSFTIVAVKQLPRCWDLKVHLFTLLSFQSTPTQLKIEGFTSKLLIITNKLLAKMTSTFSKVYEEIESNIVIDFNPIHILSNEKSWSLNNKIFEIQLRFLKYDQENHISICEFLKTKYHSTSIPKAYDVIECLVLDVRRVHEKTYANQFSTKNSTFYLSFNQWCAAYDYDNDSIRALDIYKAWIRRAQGFKRLVGDDIFKKFMECKMD
jgi:hypothetical protein